MIIKFFKKLIFIIFEISFIYIFLVFFSLLTFIIGDFLLRAIWFFYNKKRYLLSLNVFHQLFIDTFMRLTFASLATTGEISEPSNESRLSNWLVGGLRKYRYVLTFSSTP